MAEIKISRPRGRPRKDGMVPITLRLPDIMLEGLERVGERRGETRNELIYRLLTWYLHELGEDVSFHKEI